MSLSLYKRFPHSLTLHHEHDTTWFLQLADHFLQTVSTDDICSLCLVCQKVVHFGGCSIESTNLTEGETLAHAIAGNTVVTHDDSVIIHVENQVLTHDSQSNDSDVSPVVVVHEEKPFSCGESSLITRTSTHACLLLTKYSRGVGAHV